MTRDIKGMALIAVILLVVMAASAILAIASLISNTSRVTEAGSGMGAAIAAAQAGVYAALDDYATGSLWTKQANLPLVDNKYYSYGKDANFLRIDASNPRVDGTDLERLPLYNRNQTQSITVNQVKVEWYNFSGTTLEVIRLGNSNRWNNGGATSGQLITLETNFTMNATQSYTGTTQNRLRFADDIPANAIIIATFYFTDGSSRKAILLNGGRGGNHEFSITATGRVSGSVDWKRTIETTYDIGVSKITSWQEVDSHI